MDSRIRILDERTANQIAAGEVVERPASVVKELVENAIDAGSTRVEVRLQEGGIRKIQVKDNGIGMSREDCQRAFSRHATSKINDAGDLFKIKTLGFRGEALPSIAAVSMVKLISRQPNAIEGTRICLEGGKITQFEVAGCPAGTDITVENLFYNTPARKKYLRKPGTEATHAINTVRRLAVAYPEISLQLWHNDQQVFAAGGSGKLEDVLIDLYGLAFVDNMVPVSFSSSHIDVEGFVGKSFHHRSSRELQIFIVNGRYVRSPLLQAALEEAYRGLLPSRRYPVAVIKVNVPAGDIDVNVHPAKLEVKFAKPEEVSRNLKEAVGAALMSANHIPVSTGTVKEGDAPPKRIERVRDAVEAYLQTQWTMDVKPQAPAFIPKVEPRMEKADIPQPAAVPPVTVVRPTEVSTRIFPDLTAIGQLHDSFILAQGQDGLYVIDQHGAHERINFEALQDKAAEAATESQVLAIPVTLDLNPVDQDLLVERIVQLSELGIIIEHFGKNTFLIRGVPPGITG
ncbi:MAG: DNA mismatch repair endonuclease MutL, partial [Clostridia bacterium]|nr:DNA mismatch repair endonuclease MutL [Clostridia bacterium]